jgi:mRNA interferase RelE/StbE
LHGEFAGLWRYRVGDWRLVCRIEDKKLIVLVLTIGHRREIYR